MARANLASGVTVALLTPIAEDGAVDHPALERLVGSTLAAGVTGVSPLGSTGEGYSLAPDDRLAVTKTVRAVAGGEIPVIAGVFAHGPAQALAEIEACHDAGASAVLLAPPSYYPLDPAEIDRYFTTVADRSPVPLVLYNIPVYTKVSLPAPVVAGLAAHPRIAGIKDSSRDLGYFLSVLDAVGAAGLTPAEFGVLTGSDAMLLSCLVAGGAGTICASANVVPELSVGLFDAYGSGDLDTARDRERRLRAVIAACAIAAPAGIKAAAAARGLCGPAMVAPRQALGEAQLRALTAALLGLGVL